MRSKAAEHLSFCLLPLLLPIAAICCDLPLLVALAQPRSHWLLLFDHQPNLHAPCLQSTACHPPQLWATAQSCGT